MSTGSFTATLTGISQSKTYTVYYAKDSNGVVTLDVSPGLMINGTSNSAGKTLTGMPSDLWPVRIVHSTNFSGSDNGQQFVACMASIRPADGTIDLNYSPANLGWTDSGAFSAYPFVITYLGTP